MLFRIAHIGVTCLAYLSRRSFSEDGSLGVGGFAGIPILDSRTLQRSADLEIRDTAGLEACATTTKKKLFHGTDRALNAI